MKNNQSSVLKSISLYLIAIIVAVAAQPLHSEWLISKVSQNTLFVRSFKNAPRQGSATAFEIKASSGKVYTVTNAHVCGLANSNKEILIQDKLGSGRLIPIKILEVFPDNDLCILEGLANYDGLDIASSSAIGDQVYALGYPYGEALNYSFGRIKDFNTIEMYNDEVSPEECNGSRFRINNHPFYGPVCLESFKSVATDLIIHPGNSGSAMVNIYGNVVGVIFASNQRTHWGHAVPLDHLTTLLKAY